MLTLFSELVSHQVKRLSECLSKHSPKRLTWWVLFTLSSGLILTLSLFLLDRLFPLHLPEQDKMYAQVVVDADNKPLRAFADHDGVWRYPISLEQVSPLYLQALLTYEDQYFWSHPGVNPVAFLRAAYLNIRYGKLISGGSTLSMQVARLLHPHKRSLGGKVVQILRTLQLEWHLSKSEILSLYCNIAPFGGTLQGVQAASYTYLNKPASDLSHAEAALLAVLPQSPTRLRPDINSARAQAARDKVLDRMVQKNIWSAALVEEAKIERVSAYRAVQEQRAPLLARRLRKAYPNNGLIQSTIDGDLQASLEDYAKQYVGHLPIKTSAAILVVDNTTAEVKAYVGTADFGNPERYGHVDMVQALRSPGSTLKPFVYAMALDRGYIHSHSLLADVPRTWGDYRPENFNRGFAGPVSATEALQRSLNLPAVDLLERVGVNTFAAAMNNAHLPLQIPNNQPNLSLILGGAGISLEKLVSGYMAFANKGKTRPLVFTRPFFTRSSIQQEKLKANKNQRFFFSESSAWVVQNMLSGINRPAALRTRANIHKKQKLAWKTGTSYGNRDSWAIGVSATYTVGVWVGRPDGTASPGHTGGATAGPLLHAVADQLGLANDPIPQPNNIQQEMICWPLGTKLDENKKHLCHQQLNAWVIDDHVPPTWHRTEKTSWQNLNTSFWVDSKTGLRVNQHCLSQMSSTYPAIEKRSLARWPKVLTPWLSKYLKKQQMPPPLDKRCDSDTIINSGHLQITGIENGNTYLSQSAHRNTARVKLSAFGGGGHYHWYINGKYLSSRVSGDRLSHPLSQKGRYQIVVVDDVGNSDMVTVRVEGG